MNALRNFLYRLSTEYRVNLVLAQLRRHLKTGRDICLVHQMGRVVSMPVVIYGRGYSFCKKFILGFCRCILL